MDGGNLRTLYTGSNMGNIGFITADISARKLYWGVSGSGVVCILYMVETLGNISCSMCCLYSHWLFSNCCVTSEIICVTYFFF